MTDGEDNKQLKFMEILLIVGGIIGGLGLKNDDPSIKALFAFFLISSLMYYNAVSNKRNGDMFALVSSVLFAALITYPVLVGPLGFWGNYPTSHKIVSGITASALFVAIYRSLQEKSELKNSITILILGIFLTLAILYGLYSVKG